MILPKTFIYQITNNKQMGALCAKPEVPTTDLKLSSITYRTIDDIEDLIIDTVYKNSNKITREYSIESVIVGKGAFSEVRKAIHIKTNELRAVKIIYKRGWSTKQQKRILREIDIHRKLDHPNIIKIFEFFEDDKFMYIIMEYAKNGELFNKIQSGKHFNEKDAVQIFHQILSGVNHLHNNRIVHRDLKPENILLDGTVIKIADFGFSRIWSQEEKMRKSKGTIYYMAPEVLQGSYNEKCDVWSCGVILYILLTGKPPFNGGSDEIVLGHILTGKYSMHLPEFEHVSPEAKDLIHKMLQYEPTHRISIRDSLHHKWFKNALETTNGVLDSKIMSNLRSFNVRNKMQQTAYIFLVNHLATKEERKQLYDTFQALDLDKDGTLSIQELVEGYKKLDVDMNAIDLENLIKKIDSNRSGEINYSEFIVAATDRKTMLVEKRMKNCFDMIDADRNGKISINELKNVFSGKRKINEHVWKNLIEMADLNGDGEIEYHEFKELLCQMVDV